MSELQDPAVRRAGAAAASGCVDTPHPAAAFRRTRRRAAQACARARGGDRLSWSTRPSSSRPPANWRATPSSTAAAATSSSTRLEDGLERRRPAFVDRGPGIADLDARRCATATPPAAGWASAWAAPSAWSTTSRSIPVRERERPSPSSNGSADQFAAPQHRVPDPHASDVAAAAVAGRRPRTPWLRRNRSGPPGDRDHRGRHQHPQACRRGHARTQPRAVGRGMAGDRRAGGRQGARHRRPERQPARRRLHGRHRRHRAGRAAPPVRRVRRWYAAPQRRAFFMRMWRGARPACGSTSAALYVPLAGETNAATPGR
jgi:hypothetical protein